MQKIPHQLTENMKILQKCVLTHQGKVLLIKRPLDDNSRPGCWDMPGGNSEWPTELQENTSNLHQIDLAREITEETGLDLTPEQFSLSKLCYMETFYEPQREVYTVLFGWHLELPEEFDPQSIQLSHEHTEYVWAEPAAALEYDFGGPRGEFMVRILGGALHKIATKQPQA